MFDSPRQGSQSVQLEVQRCTQQQNYCSSLTPVPASCDLMVLEAGAARRTDGLTVPEGCHSCGLLMDNLHSGILQFTVVIMSCKCLQSLTGVQYLFQHR